MAGIKGAVVVMGWCGLGFGGVGRGSVELLFLCVRCFDFGFGWGERHPTMNQKQSRLGQGTIGGVILIWPAFGIGWG